MNNRVVFIIKRFSTIILLNITILSTNLVAQNSFFSFSCSYRYELKDISTIQKSKKRTIDKLLIIPEIDYLRSFSNKSLTSLFIDLKGGGGVSFLYDSFFFNSSKEKKLILLPYLKGTVAISPMRIFNHQLIINSDIKIPIRMNMESKYVDKQYFNRLNISISLLYKSKKHLPRYAFGLGTDVTPFMHNDYDFVDLQRRNHYRTYFSLFRELQK
jgi:hypothetical protein